MSIAEIVKILTDSGIEPREATREVKMLIEHYCHYTAKDVIMGRPLDQEKLKVVRQKAELRASTRQPIQYIIGRAYFMGNYYKVTPDVLIPRDETEIVVRHAIEIIREHGLETVLDVGTGSGCIACSVSENTKCKVTASDVSAAALKVAKENAEHLYQRVRFVESDLFESITEEKFDLIISNPPYIPNGVEVQKEVMFEPKGALFADDADGVEYYKKIIECGREYLTDGGYIVFELGIGQSEIVKKMFENNGFDDIRVEKDLAQIDRVISGRLKIV